MSGAGVEAAPTGAGSAVAPPVPGFNPRECYRCKVVHAITPDPTSLDGALVIVTNGRCPLCWKVFRVRVGPLSDTNFLDAHLPLELSMYSVLTS